MPSDRAIAALRDIAHHIDLAVRFAEGFEYEAFQADQRTVYAMTRCLEIISEASRRLPDDLKTRHPSIAWKDRAAPTTSIATTMRTWRRGRCERCCALICRRRGRWLREI